MTNDELVLVELQKINEQLKKQRKGLANNFLSGFLHSLGSFFGYIVVLSVLAYFASQLNWAQVISKSFETMMSSINWSKIVPEPKIEFTSPFSQPSPDRP